jgi:hypothetical protein
MGLVEKSFRALITGIPSVGSHRSRGDGGTLIRFHRPGILDDEVLQRLYIL